MFWICFELFGFFCFGIFGILDFLEFLEFLDVLELFGTFVPTARALQNQLELFTRFTARAHIQKEFLHVVPHMPNFCGPEVGTNIR